MYLCCVRSSASGYSSGESCFDTCVWHFFEKFEKYWKMQGKSIKLNFDYIFRYDFRWLFEYYKFHTAERLSESPSQLRRLTVDCEHRVFNFLCATITHSRLACQFNIWPKIVLLLELVRLYNRMLWASGLSAHSGRGRDPGLNSLEKDLGHRNHEKLDSSSRVERAACILAIPGHLVDIKNTWR